MKTVNFFLVGFACFALTTFVAAAQSIPTKFNSITELENYFGNSTQIQGDARSIRSTLGPVWPANSTSGFKNMIKINNRMYFFRIRKTELDTSGYGSVSDIKFLASVADGMTSTQEETKTTCRTFGFSQSVSATIKTVVTFETTGSYSNQRCQSRMEGTSYSFPNNCSDNYNSASFYMGMWTDRYVVTIDYVPQQCNYPAYKNCLDDCQDDSENNPSNYEKCKNYCKYEYDRSCKAIDLSKMTTYTFYYYYPRPVFWSVCNNVP
ncbi:MAG: hypothetical protein EHM45_09880 [Desulfobacteraceae bacterium]|nr:MAG: hypothetical protein EHM45_09880 [Desulfobacteraceae bacterium]